MCIVIPTVPPVFITPNPPRRRPEEKPTRQGGIVHLYSSKSGVREIVATYDLGK